MTNMFQGCNKLSSLNLTSFDTSNVKYFGNLFDHCTSLTELDIHNFNTSNAKSIQGMFQYCSSLTSLDLSSFDTSNVNNVSNMFNGCSSLISLDLSNFDMSNILPDDNYLEIEYKYGMFKECTSLLNIKCKQAFKDWCITYQDNIKLPNTMREGGNGTWEIVD